MASSAAAPGSSSAVTKQSAGNASGMDLWAMDPFAMSASMMDSMLRDPFSMMLRDPARDFGRLATVGGAMPALKVDVSETETAYVVHADAPGFTKEQVKVEVDADNVLHIGTDKREEKSDSGERDGRKWHRVERSSASAHRSIKLPANADVNHIAAKCENGVLEVMVPKIAGAAADGRRRINVV